MLSIPAFGPGGHDRITAPEYFGLMGVAHGPLRRRHSGKGRAVPERLPVDPNHSSSRCVQRGRGCSCPCSTTSRISLSMNRAQLQEHLAQADRHMAELSLDLQSAVVTPILPQTHEGSNEEIGSHQVEALKNRITELEDAKEQAAHTIATLEAAEQESR